MSSYVGENKIELSEQSTETIKEKVTKDAWIALRQYFGGAGNGPEAKVACVVIGTLAREAAARNSARQLDLLERRFDLEAPKSEVPALSQSEIEGVIMNPRPVGGKPN